MMSCVYTASKEINVRKNRVLWYSSSQAKPAITSLLAHKAVVPFSLVFLLLFFIERYYNGNRSHFITCISFQELVST